MADGASTALRVCSTCVHYVLRPSPVLFDPQDLQSPGALEEQAKWDQEQRRRALEEMQRQQMGGPFPYEPHHFAWCAHFSGVEEVMAVDMQDPVAVDAALSAGLAGLNPVTGQLTPLYHLCSVKNPEASCEQHQPRA